MIGLGLSIPALALAGQRDPRAFLGTAALGYRDAAILPSLDLAGSNVNAWTDVINGGIASQATSGAKPLWTLDANGRPMTLFDGTDDYLEQAANHPYGTGLFEIWVIASNFAVPSDVTNRWAVGFGSTSTAGIGRSVSGGVNCGRGAFGFSGWNYAAVDFTGSHILRLRGEAGQALFSVDGGNFITLGNFAPIGTGRTRIGCVASGGITGFWNGGIYAILVTALLSDAQAAQTLRWCKDRGGIA